MARAKKTSTSRSIKIKKNKFIEAYRKTLGNATSACKTIGIGRSTFYRWLRNDNDFKEQIDDIAEETIDFVEQELKKSIQNGNVTAQIFYLKTKGKHRGYVEKQEVELSGEVDNNLVIYLPDNQRDTQNDNDK